MPIGTGNFQFNYLITTNGDLITSDNSTQQVNLTLFTHTNSTYPTQFLNISFKDENSLSNLNESIPTSQFIYYLGSGTVNKTLNFINNTDNFNYSFSGTTGGTLLKVLPVIQYRRVSDYPQRIWEPTLKLYNSTITNQILYSLNTNDGIFVTYQVLDNSEQPISGVDVTSTRIVSGKTIQVSSGFTDISGTVTFWVNPDFQHTTTFSKEGYESLIFIHFPTQNAYTLNLGGEVEIEPICFSGINQLVKPSESFLWQNELYDFNYTVSSSYWNLTSFQFILSYGNGTLIGSNSSTSSNGGIISLNDINVSDSSSILMSYFFEIDGDCGQIVGSKVWITQSTEGTEYSIKYLFTQINSYLSLGLFGIDNFGRILLCFVIIVFMVGGMSKRYGLASEPAMMGILFGSVFMLDVGLNLIPIITIGSISAMPYFLTYITFIIMFAYIIKGERFG
jgi:hypothetical protein